jgi:hypothetical protein
MLRISNAKKHKGRIIWGFIGVSHYADHPVLNGKRIGQRRTLYRSSDALGEGGSIHIDRC